MRAASFRRGDVGAGFGALFGKDRQQTPQEPLGIRVVDGQIDDQAAVLLEDGAVLELVLRGGEREAHDRGIEQQKEPAQGRAQKVHALALVIGIKFGVEVVGDHRIGDLTQELVTALLVQEHASQLGEGEPVIDQDMRPGGDDLLKGRRGIPGVAVQLRERPAASPLRSAASWCACHTAA